MNFAWSWIVQTLVPAQNDARMAGRPHFLVVTFPLQGHINPALRLAHRLAATGADTLVTFSTTASAHRRMFPAESDGDSSVAPEVGGRLAFLPFSDGTQNGYVKREEATSFNDYMATFHKAGAASISELIGALAARRRPVSCVVYTLLLPWAADVARAHGIPSALYWIQPVAVFAMYYYYYHGHGGAIVEHRDDPSFTVQFPGLPPHAMRDLPSFLTDSISESDFYHGVFTTFGDLFDTLDKEKVKATVLVNTCQELEAGELAAVDAYEILPIGPLLPSGKEAGLFEHDESSYTEWLDTKPARSVLYVSFGSLTAMRRAEELQELLLGLEEIGRPYLFAMRKESRAEVEVDVKNGVVVGWCDQARVLSHPAVGCFVTHCGWNSVLESLACGVPMVGAPEMSDQGMNARMVESSWRVGKRAEKDAGGVLRRGELRRCVEAVMGDGEDAAEVRRMSAVWKETVGEALKEGGSSDRNLMAFIEGVRSGI